MKNYYYLVMKIYHTKTTVKFLKVYNHLFADRIEILNSNFVIIDMFCTYNGSHL